MTADFSPPPLALARAEEHGAPDREIVLSRLLDAPRTLAWQAWTQPQQLAQWWGPRGFTNTIEAMDVRPGGLLRFGMHDPEGVNHPNKITYREVVPFERLVYLHTRDQDDDFTPFQVTVTLDEQGEKTRLSMRLLFESVEERAQLAEFWAGEGGRSMLDCLQEHLAQQTNLQK